MPSRRYKAIFKMKKIFFPFALFLYATFAFSKGGVGPSQLEFKDWGSSKPMVAVVFSDPFSSRFVSRKPLLYRWVDSKGQPVEPQNSIICRIVHPSDPQLCEAWYAKSQSFQAQELYLGPPSGFFLSPTSSPSSIGVKDLESIPLSPTKLLLLNIAAGKTASQQVLVAAYSDISDDDLRQMALEYGFYPALSWTIE